MKEPTPQQQRQKLIEEAFLQLEGEHEMANNAFKVSREINTFLEDAREQGFHDMGKLNQMTAEQIANQALNYGDKDFLDFIYEIKTYGDSNYGQTIAGQNLIRTVSDRIDRQKDDDEQRAYTRYTRNKSMQKESFMLRLGELRNKRSEEGFDFQGQLSTLIQEMNQAGLVGEAESVQKYELDKRNQLRQDDVISFDDDEITKTLMDLMQEEGPSGVHTYILKHGLELEEKYLRSILNSSDKIIPIKEIGPYSNALSGFKAHLNNIGRQDLAGFLAKINFSGDIESQIPSEFISKRNNYIADIQQILQKEYQKIALMEGGRRNFNRFTPDQYKAFYDLIRPDLQSQQEGSLGDLMRRAETDLNSVMIDHINKRNPLKSQKVQEADVLNKLHLILFDSPASGSEEVSTRKIKNRFAELKDEMKDGTLMDNDLENYLESQGINVDSPSDKDLKQITEVLSEIEDMIIELETTRSNAN